VVCVCVFARFTDTCQTTDIDRGALAALRASSVTHIDVVARRGVAQV
jgi:hypothetical protein